MKHVNRETAEAATEQTMKRLGRIVSRAASRGQDADLRDVVSALSIHALTLGQFELSNTLQSILIGEGEAAFESEAIEAGFQ